MTEQTVRDEITDFVRTELVGDPDMELAPDLELLLSGVVDSMGAIRLVGFVEERWDLQVPPQDVTVEHFGTVADLAAYVTAQRVA